MFAQLIVWLNTLANSVAGVLQEPMAAFPVWLSCTLSAMAVGVLLLLVYKYATPQTQIRLARNRIKADLLALTLFKDDLRIVLRSQLNIFAGSLKVLALSLPALLLSMVPTCLILAQLALWYEARPLAIGEQVVVTVQLADDANELLTSLSLASGDSFTVKAGPVRVPDDHLACWSIEARVAGRQELRFIYGEEVQNEFTKEFVIGGEGPVSLRRPSALRWTDVILHPREVPFPLESSIQSIEVTYPQRVWQMPGRLGWLTYWFLVSVGTAVVARPFLGVYV